jgi:hypothetical protein
MTSVTPHVPPAVTPEAVDKVANFGHQIRARVRPEDHCPTQQKLRLNPISGSSLPASLVADDLSNAPPLKGAHVALRLPLRALPPFRHLGHARVNLWLPLVPLAEAFLHKLRCLKPQAVGQRRVAALERVPKAIAGEVNGLSFVSCQL